MFKKIKLIYISAFYKIVHFYILNSNKILPEDKLKKLLAFLNDLLQKVPFWAEGHLEYALICIDNKMIEEAYASVCAVEILKDKRFLNQARLVKAKCFLNMNDLERGITLLLELKNNLKDDLKVLIELASAYVMLGEKEKASSVLSEIPKEKDTPEISILRDYCENRE